MPWSEDEVARRQRFEAVKSVLAGALGWPYLENLSWFRAWPGGWCLHGRASCAAAGGDQRSINFELPEEVHDPLGSLLLAVERVRKNPERLQAKMRWHCPEHGWEVVLLVGVMHSGCPKCGVYYCEPWPAPAQDEEE
jgi:hypothetical protein